MANHIYQVYTILGFFEVILCPLRIISCADKAATWILAQIVDNFFGDVNSILTKTSATPRHPLAEKLMDLKLISLFIFFSDSPESEENNAESMQRAVILAWKFVFASIQQNWWIFIWRCIQYINFKLKIQNDLIRSPFDITLLCHWNIFFIVDLTKLDNIKDVTRNDAEKWSIMVNC